jgi:hyperosmotically inducible protein
MSDFAADARTRERAQNNFPSRFALAEFLASRFVPNAQFEGTITRYEQDGASSGTRYALIRVLLSCDLRRCQQIGSPRVFLLQTAERPQSQFLWELRASPVIARLEACILEGCVMLKLGTAFLTLSVLLIAPTIASADDSTRSRSDGEITTRVKTALIRNDETKARQINVETENGVVQLSGFVDSENMKTAAAATAQSVSGVQEVRNELIVRQGDRSVGRGTDDAVIAAKVKSELATESGLASAAHVNVEVRSGVVQLSGFVSSADEKREAEQIASQVAGVTDVRNSIAVEPSR